MSKLYRILYGRYGIDELYKFNAIIYIILVIINIFIKSNIITYIELFLLIIIFYRSLSKNKIARQKENNKYLQIKNIITKKFQLLANKWHDRNTHLYKRCPNCKKILRLPLKKGLHTVKCPDCNNRFKVKCRRNEKVKVEVIKNK